MMLLIWSLELTAVKIWQKFSSAQFTVKDKLHAACNLSGIKYSYIESWQDKKHLDGKNQFPILICASKRKSSCLSFFYVVKAG